MSTGKQPLKIILIEYLLRNIFQYNKDSKHGEFLWTHTTASMGIGFQVNFLKHSKLNGNN